MLIVEGYGLTESSAASFVNLPTDFKFGTVGKPIPQVLSCHFWMYQPKKVQKPKKRSSFMGAESCEATTIFQKPLLMSFHIDENGKNGCELEMLENWIAMDS